MEKGYKTPGVYIEEHNAFGSTIVANPTAVPVFIGFTQFANQKNGKPLDNIENARFVHQPTLIHSLLEYEQQFGMADTSGRIMVELDQNSGTFTATHKSASSEDEFTPGLMHPSILNYFANGGGSCYIISLGSYDGFDNTVKADDISNQMPAIEKALKQAETATLIVPTDLIRFGRQHYYTWGVQLIDFCDKEKKYFTIMDVVQEEPNSTTFEQSDINTYRSVVRSSNPSYAGAYYPYLETLTPYAYKEDLSNVYLNGNKLNIDTEGVTGQTILDVKKFLATNYINMPPSPFMAGIYSTTDNTFGVWKAPANVSVANVIKPAVLITNAQQEGLNIDPSSGISVNAIRQFTGKGTLVWGARTNDGNSLDWRYINVRRLAIAITNDINSATEAYIFKPYVHDTWVEIKTMIESYLLGLFNQGALAGSTPSESYQVQIGEGVTMTPEDIQNGIMRVTIMIAPVRPAEFIVLKFSQMMAQ